MTYSTPTPDDFRSMTWEQIEPLYSALVDRELTDDASTKAWLDEWNDLDISLFEAASVANVDVSCDSLNEEKEAIHLRFSSEILPQVGKIENKLTGKLLDSGYSIPELETVLRRARTDREIFRDENVPLFQQLSKLTNAYNKICGAMTVEWDGEEVPLSRLNPLLESPDAEIRERAWRLQLQPYIDKRDELADIFDEMLSIRQQIAVNAGFENYRDYVFAEKHRYDYTPEDCYQFHDAVAATFVPARQALDEERKQVMGVDSLRPWDLSHDPEGREPLKPYDTMDDAIRTAVHVFGKVDPVFGEQFNIMREEGLLDLESRTGKRPGGFCTGFPYRKRPFIFMNASGTGGDIRTLLHEAGHAFHGFACSEHLPYLKQRRYGSEMAEVASMSMELLTSPYLREKDGGYYKEEEYARARIEHLEGIVKLFGWVAPVDAFQQWLYTDPAGADRDARDAKWVEIWSRFDPDTDWTDLNDWRVARWYRQLHIFLYPFYYIEYAIAQLGALQVWRNALNDQQKAVEDYRAALALGGSRPLPELFATAGARLIFDEDGMAELVGLIQGEIEKLKSGSEA